MNIPKKHYSMTALTLTSLLILAGPANSHASALLSVDFSPAGSNIQSSFESFATGGDWTGAGDTVTQIFGSYNVTITAGNFGASGYTRDATNTEFTDFTFQSLFRDGAQRLSATDGLSVSGLTASTTYTVQLWFYDAQFGNNATMEFIDYTTGAPISLGIVTNNTIASGNASFPDPDAYSVTGDVTTNLAGSLIFGMVGSDLGGMGKISGFTVTAVPEPSSYALLIGTASALLMIYRRRMRK